MVTFTAWWGAAARVLDDVAVGVVEGELARPPTLLLPLAAPSFRPIRLQLRTYQKNWRVAFPAEGEGGVGVGVRVGVRVGEGVAGAVSQPKGRLMEENCEQ